MKVTFVIRDCNSDGLEETLPGLPEDVGCEIIWQKQNIREAVSDNRVKLVSPAPYPDSERNDRVNYALALFYSSDGLLIEDDVILSKNFSNYVTQVKNAIDAERYMITLYTSDHYEKGDTIELVEFPVFQFSETIAMLYDPITKIELGKWILAGMTLEEGRKDFAIKSFSNEFGIPIFTTNYSLVYKTSEGLSDA
jgi:hypothetical protein